MHPQNDPAKTVRPLTRSPNGGVNDFRLSKLCTTAFLVEISQYIKIGDLTVYKDPPATQPDSEPTFPEERPVPLLSFSLDDAYGEMGSRLTNEEEDALLKVCF